MHNLFCIYQFKLFVVFALTFSFVILISYYFIPTYRHIVVFYKSKANLFKKIFLVEANQFTKQMLYVFVILGNLWIYIHADINVTPVHPLPTLWAHALARPRACILTINLMYAYVCRKIGISFVNRKIFGVRYSNCYNFFYLSTISLTQYETFFDTVMDSKNV